MRIYFHICEYVKTHKSKLLRDEKRNIVKIIRDIWTIREIKIWTGKMSDSSRTSGAKCKSNLPNQDVIKFNWNIEANLSAYHQFIGLSVGNQDMFGPIAVNDKYNVNWGIFSELGKMFSKAAQQVTNFALFSAFFLLSASRRISTCKLSISGPFR